MSGTVTMKGLASDTDWSALISDIQKAQKAYVITPLEDKKTKNTDKLTAWQSINTSLSAIVSYIGSYNLDKTSGYNLYSSSLYSSDSTVIPANVLSPSLGSISGPGKYSVEVTALAQAEKISSDSFSSKTADLGITGDIFINGKKVTIQAGDTLTNVASRINSADAGVTATILSISSTEYKLLLESNQTGASGIALKNGSSSNILQSLNLLTTTKQLAHASGSDALSDTYTSKTSAIGTLMGLSTPASGTIQIKGTDNISYNVNVNLSTATLESIAASVNTANGGTAIPGVTASVEGVSVNGTTSYRLKLTNVGISALTDSNNMLDTLGIISSTKKNSLRSGQDATIKIDGNTITSSSNTVTDAISGVSLNLVGTNTGKPIELRVTLDSSKVTDKASSIANSVNNALSAINEQKKYSADGVKPLFGDTNLTSIKNSINSVIFKTVSGNSVYTDASSIGIAFDHDGKLSVDTTKMTAALSTNRQEAINVLKSLSDSLKEKMNVYVDPYTGTIQKIETAIKANTTGIDARLKELNDRFDKQKEVLEKRFNALELLISQSNSTKSWLTQQVNYMTGQNK